MQPELSVVIPTYNRAQLLKENLRALFNQSLSRERFEIIVIDDGSGDGTAEMLAEIKGRTTHHLRTYCQENKLAGSARNLGIQKAQGVIILLMDDDITPNPDLLKQHLEFHQKYPETEVGVFGRVMTGSTGIDLCHHDNRNVHCIGTTKDGDRLVYAGNLTTPNLSLKREFIIQAGLFTDGLPCLQDKELGFRLKEKGLRLIYCQEAVGIHRDPLDTVEKVVRSGKKYGRTLAEWYERIPQFQKEITSFAGRFNGGWRHFASDPLQYLKDAGRRWAINQYTIGLVLRIAHRMPITNPPKKILVRCCIEIWAYYYRHEFQKRKLELAKSKCPGGNSS